MQLDPKSTALVLIDLQKGVLAMPVAPHKSAEVYEGSMRLAQCCHAVKVPAVWVRVSFSANLADAPHLSSQWLPMCRSIPAIHQALGSEEAMRIRTGCCDSTTPKGWISPV